MELELTPGKLILLVDRNFIFIFKIKEKEKKAENPEMLTYINP